MTLTYLAQTRPAGTAAVTLYQTQSGEEVILRKLFITNSDNQDRTFSIFFDNDGTTYDATTALKYNTSIPKGGEKEYDLLIPMRNSAGAIGVRADKADSVTFTLTGEK